MTLALALAIHGTAPAQDAKKPAPKPAPAAQAAPAAEPKVEMKESKPAADPNGPKMEITQEKVDVGTVAKGEVIKQPFVVKNTGKSDLHITDVKPSCGCTVPEYDKVIKPGTEGKIVLNVDTKTFQGPISKTALVVSDDPSSPQATIFISAVVKPYVEALPYQFFRIQALTGEPATSELVLVSDEADFKPSKAEVNQTYLKVNMAPVPEKERLPNKNPNQFKVTLTSNADAPEGLVGGYVKVATGVKKQPEMDIAISGYVKPTITVTPLSVNFGNFEAAKGDPVKRNVMLVNNNSKNAGFEVMKVETNISGVTAEVVSLDKQRVQVVLTVDQKMKKGVFDGQLTIKTNDQLKNEIKVPIKGVIL